MPAINTKTATPTRNVKVLASIGRGDKQHPAFATRWDTDPGTPWNRTGYTIESFACSCPNAANGRARHSATITNTSADAWDGRTCRREDGMY